MGAMATIFDPQGNKGEIPQERLMDAVKAGAKPAITIKSPDGKLGDIPADRIQDAVKAGASIVPLQSQENQHPGFWHSLYSDVSGMASGAFHAAVDPLTDTHEDLVRKLHQEQADAAAPPSAERMAHGALYRNVAVPAAQAVGVNVQGMEQSAAAGDVAGVAGHAAAPLAVMAATEGAVRGAPLAVDAVKAAKPYAGPIAKAALKTADIASFERFSKAYEAWKNLPAQIRAKTEPPVFPGASLPAKPPAEVLQASSLSRGPQTVTDPSAGLGQIPVQPGAAGSMAESVAKPPVKPAVVEQQLKQALGAQDLKPGVPLKDQLRGANAQPKPQLPEGFTPVESTAMKGFKYDPATREFETITQGGQRYVHGDVSPEDAQAFMDAESKGKAWQQIRENPLVAKVINGKRIATKPTASAEAAPTDDLMPKLQESLKQAQAAKATAAPKFVYRARDVGESGVPVNNDLAQATSDPFQALKYAEAGQRGAKAGEVVKIDLSKLKPSDYVVKTHPSGAKWIQFTRPLTEDEVSAFTGKTAGKK